MKRAILLIIFIFLATYAHADDNYASRYLTAQEIQRVKALRILLAGIDQKSLKETVDELEKSRHPRIDLQMKEAMAKTYVDLVRQFNVEGQKKKEWLYSMICLNMAYLQFGGLQGKSGSTTELNRLIQQKLKEYIPSNTFKQFRFIFAP